MPADSGVRLADLVAAFSLATDLGLGQPMDHVLRSWRIAAELGEHVGLEPEDRGSLYFVVTLAWVGCVADTPEVAALFGDDIAFRADSYDVDFTGLPMLGFMLRHVGAGRPPLHRLRLATNLVATGGKAVQRGLMSHCLTTARMAERFELGAEVCRPLQQVFARWDGKGVPDDLGGEEIDLPMRLFHLADAVEVHHRTGGTDAAVDLARAKQGTHFDPTVVDAFCAVADDVLGDPATEHDWDALLDLEPTLQTTLSDDQFDAALEAIADFTDLRSVHRAGHSRAVAELAERAVSEQGLPPADVLAVRRAGLVHDLGLHGIPATILDRPETLRPAEWERLRMHPYYTERMLARPAALARLGAIASLVRERGDGSGYPRRLTAATIPATARTLAAACSFQAMVEPRAHRPALTPKQAAAELRAEVRAGRLDATAVDAVLAAAGQPSGKRRLGPSGLTPREIEVLVLIARGGSTRQVAQHLSITRKTAETHIERIYAKTGASTRSTATLFALQQGLLGSLQPLDL
jgi:HD-GYP domain-containing protein (c-di-GMP phosphodiesterase class II)/DNA-binding CsgD family transcriptional regulator